MYDLEIDNEKTLQVKTRKHTFEYAIDGSKENPLEATYAALSGCAGVYAIKACKKLNISPVGIKVSGRPYIDKNNPTMLSKWTTVITFPESWNQEVRDFVKDEIQKCAVKELILNGPSIEFVTEEHLLPSLEL